MRISKFLIPGMAALLLIACTDKQKEWDALGVFETTEVIVSARGTGEIKRLDIEEGQEVAANATVGYVDTTQLALRRKQLVATLSATESRRLNEEKQLASLRQQIANAKAEQQRFQKLVQDEAATQKQLDDINYNLEVLEKQLVATSEQIGSANTSLTGQSASIVAQVAQIDDQIANCIIVSPIAGRVLGKYAERGEFAAPGRALFKVGNVEDMKLRAYVSAEQVTGLKIGQKVSVFADKGVEESQTFEGTVTWISDEAEFTPKTIQTREERSNLVYAVKIAVKNDGTIKRGMYGNVKF